MKIRNYELLATPEASCWVFPHVEILLSLITASRQILCSFSQGENRGAGGSGLSNVSIGRTRVGTLSDSFSQAFPRNPNPNTLPSSHTCRSQGEATAWGAGLGALLASNAGTHTVIVPLVVCPINLFTCSHLLPFCWRLPLSHVHVSMLASNTKSIPSPALLPILARGLTTEIISSIGGTGQASFLAHPSESHFPHSSSLQSPTRSTFFGSSRLLRDLCFCPLLGTSVFSLVVKRLLTRGVFLLVVSPHLSGTSPWLLKRSFKDANMAFSGHESNPQMIPTD